MPQFPAIVSLASLTATTGFRLDGGDATDLSGVFVASAGDVNGDGFADIIIGAIGGDPGGDASAGESYVVFGKASGFGTVNLASLNGANGFRIDGINPGDNAGFSVASAGDINGDGVDDIIVGAPKATANGASQSGQSYVVFGRGPGSGGFSPSVQLDSLNGLNGFLINGGGGEYSGVSVAAVGDVNGDGIGDLVVGAERGTPGGARRSMPAKATWCSEKPRPSQRRSVSPTSTEATASASMVSMGVTAAAALSLRPGT